MLQHCPEENLVWVSTMSYFSLNFGLNYHELMRNNLFIFFRITRSTGSLEHERRNRSSPDAIDSPPCEWNEEIQWQDEVSLKKKKKKAIDCFENSLGFD